MKPAELDLDDVQGDVLIGLQKNVENFVFSKSLTQFLLKQLQRNRWLSGLQAQIWSGGAS